MADNKERTISDLTRIITTGTISGGEPVTLTFTAKDGTQVPVSECDVLGTSGQDLGYCLDCGSEHLEVEPDACNYECADCGKDSVFGASELLIMGCIS